MESGRSKRWTKRRLCVVSPIHFPPFGPSTFTLVRPLSIRHFNPRILGPSVGPSACLNKNLGIISWFIANNSNNSNLGGTNETTVGSDSWLQFIQMCTWHLSTQWTPWILERDDCITFRIIRNCYFLFNLRKFKIKIYNARNVFKTQNLSDNNETYAKVLRCVGLGGGEFLTRNLRKRYWGKISTPHKIFKKWWKVWIFCLSIVFRCFESKTRLHPRIHISKFLCRLHLFFSNFDFCFNKVWNPPVSIAMVDL